MIKVLIVLIIFLLEPSLRGEEVLQLQITHTGKNSIILTAGDVNDLKMYAWPRELASDIEKNIKEIYITPELFILGAEDIRVSENNSDVYEMNIRVVAVDAFKYEFPYNTTIGGRTALVYFKKVSGVNLELPKDHSKYFVLNQDVLIEDDFLFILIGAVISILLVVGYFYGVWFQKKRKEAAEKTRQLIEKDMICKRVINARTRDEIESVYKDRVLIQDSKCISPELFKDLCIHIDEIQYKKAWSDHEHQKVIRKLDEIKDGVNNDIFT